MKSHFKLTYFVPCILSIVAFTGGCDADRREPEYRAASGTFEAINVQSGVVTFRFVPNESGQSREDRGLVPSDTEILINGKLSELRDLVVGERVFTVWRVEKLRGRQLNTALKIHVTRDGDESSS